MDVKQVRKLREKNVQIMTLIRAEADYLEDNGWTRQTCGYWAHPDHGGAKNVFGRHAEVSYWHPNAVAYQKAKDAFLVTEHIQYVLR